MIQTSDGGYAITGTIAFSVANGGDVLLVKTDANGNVQWNRTYEGLGIHEQGRWVLQTADGGYTIACETSEPAWSSASGNSLLLIKTDASGNFLWRKTWGVEHPCSVVQTADGGYGLLGLNFTGYTRSLLAKTDAAGNVQWEKTLWQPPIESSANEPVTIYNYAESLVQTVEGGYAIAGYVDTVTFRQPDRYFTDSYQFLLVKTDANGDILWEKTYGGTDDVALSLVQTADDGYAILGNTNSNKKKHPTESLDLALVKTDASGNFQWRKTFGGTMEDYASEVIQTSDGAYVVVGSTYSYDDKQVFLVKTNGEGEFGLDIMNSTPNALTFYRGRDDVDWNYVRVRVWKND
jgi:regulation of enolase protein 1 (concanavalin A-like superfamily)